MRIVLIALFVLNVNLVWGQASTGIVKQTGSCNAANSGDNSTVTITCVGIGAQQGKQIITVLDKILDNQVNADWLSGKLDEILKAAYAAPKSQPRIADSGFELDSIDAKGIHFHIGVVNDGDEIAFDRTQTTHWIVGPLTYKTEDDLFGTLYQFSKDRVQPRGDQPPGDSYKMSQYLTVDPLSEQEKAAWSIPGNVLYLGHLQCYRGNDGTKFVTELCMFMKIDGSLHYCGLHNVTARKVPQSDSGKP